MAYNLDMSKAYDRMNWWFLQSVLLYTNFPTQFINVIMLQCVTSVSYSVVVNGEPVLLLRQVGVNDKETPSPHIYL